MAAGPGLFGRPKVTAWANMLVAVATAILCLCGKLAQAQTCLSGKYTVCQAFDSPWSGNLSPDALWRINGRWVGTGGDILDPALARLVLSGSDKRQLWLSVAAGEKRGSEIQTLSRPGYSYGYYETQMKVSPVPGVCASFFWIEAPGYGPHEWDIEFLTDDFKPGTGAVHLTLHPSDTTYILALPFNPSDDFHRYGFLWTPGRIVFTVDGRPAHAFNESTLTTSIGGFIMANAITGIPHWCNGPPTQSTTSIYNWMSFTAGATTIIQP